MEWAAVHRKHHAKCDTPEDPHSPQIYGINRVLWLGVFLYVKECSNRETLERYGRATPDDWIERNAYSKLAIYGVFITLAADLLLFGAVPELDVGWLYIRILEALGLAKVKHVCADSAFRRAQAGGGS